MITDPSAAMADVYTDFQGLAQLRAAARAHSPQALRQAAQQFEALFIEMMLKSMRKADFGDSLFDNRQVRFYRELFDHQLALQLSRTHTFGLARMLIKRLGGAEGTRTAPAANTSAAGTAAPVPRPATVTPGAPSEPAMRDYDTPADFARAVWPDLQRAAAALGVSPRVLLAQAALETGWGRNVIRRPDGRSSYNLFGIKAGGPWNGERVAVPTLEYQDGVAVKTLAQFRAYATPAAAVNDYVALLREDPRYREALAQAGDARAFAAALQRAGYATDPGYAHKISAVLGSRAMDDALAALKVSQSEPLS